MWHALWTDGPMDRLCEHMVGGLFLGALPPFMAGFGIYVHIDIYLTHFIHMHWVFFVCLSSLPILFGLFLFIFV